MELAERALLRVFRDGQPIGIGFLIGERLALTCAHLVAGDRVDVDFPMLGEGCAARVVHRRTGLDIVGLELESVPQRAKAR